MERFARRLHQIQETLEKRAVSHLEQVRQAEREEWAQSAQLEQHRRQAGEHGSQVKGADWHGLHLYREALRSKAQVHREKASELSDEVARQRSHVMSVHREVRKWEQAVTNFRAVDREAIRTGEQRQSDDHAAIRWGKEGHV